jgi:hypothetical protein
MLADLWWMVNTIVVPNSDDCNTDVGNSSGSIKRGGRDYDLVVPPLRMTRWCPCLLPPPLVLLVIVIFNATSLLPTMAPVNRGILPPPGGNTQWRNGDQRGRIPPMAHGGTANIGAISSGSPDGNREQRTTRLSQDNGSSSSRWRKSVGRGHHPQQQQQ